MIDKIRFSKKNLTDSEIANLVQKNNLDKYVNGLEVSYNNLKLKNFTGGWYIRIDAKKNLIIDGSLHKFYNWNFTQKLDNFNRFTMHQAKETFLLFIELIGLNSTGVTITNFEVGINVITNFEPINFLDNVRSIGDFDNEKILYINPKYKERKFLTTEFHKDYRIVFKAYDKIFEMNDRKKAPPEKTNILRIETVHKRCEKKYLIDFLNIENLKKVQNSFFYGWDKLNFFVEAKAPKNTSQSKISLAKNLFNKTPTIILDNLKQSYNNGGVTIKSYYTQKRFIENWEIEKTNFEPTKTLLCKKWEILYNTEKQIHSENLSVK